MRERIRVSWMLSEIILLTLLPMDLNQAEEDFRMYFIRHSEQQAAEMIREARMQARLDTAAAPARSILNMGRSICKHLRTGA